MSGIVWIASYPKSGNTWMRAFLSNFILLLQKNGKTKAATLQQMGELIPSEALASYHNNYQNRQLDSKDDKTIARYRCQVQAKLAMAEPKLRFLKTHNYLGQAYDYELFNQNYMSGAIYIVRNPFDVAISWARHLNISTDEAIDFMASESAQTPTEGRMVFEKMTDWSNHVYSWTKQKLPELLLVLRYEDMLQNPLKSFSSVVRFIQIKCPKKILLAAIANANFDKLKEQEKKEAFTERPKHLKHFFNKGKAGQWKETLTKEQIKNIYDKHSEQIKRFGYDIS